MPEQIDLSIYNEPDVIQAIDRITKRYEQSDEMEVLTLWLKVPWKPGAEMIPCLFTSEDRIVGCVAIYDPLDGRLL